MTTLVAGATGATGRLLVAQLLERGQSVKAILRSPDKLPEDLKYHDNLRVIHASILELSDAELAQHVSGCEAVASCLGHNLTFKGLFGEPRRLVTEAVHKLCSAVQANAPQQPVKFVLMNTAGNSNRDLQEPVSTGQKVVLTLIRTVLPPHVDNEAAADYLRTKVDRNGMLEWVVVRPDSLLNQEEVSTYTVHASPTRSAIFNPGKTSRVNVAHFMADLITKEDLWQTWRWQMPVIYNS